MRRAAVSLSIAWRRQSAITEAGMNQFCDKLIAMAGAVVAEGLSVPPRGMTSKGSPQFAKLGTQVLRLRSTRKFFWIGERQGYAVAVFVCHCRANPKRYLPAPIQRRFYVRRTLRARMRCKFLVEIAEKTGARFDTGRIACRIQLVAIHPIDTETLQTALFIEKADTVSVMERFHSGNGKVVAALLFHRTHLLAQGLRRIERGDFPVATLQEVMGEAAAETLVQLGREVETASTRRSTYVLLATGENGIQLAAVGSRNVLHIGNVLQPPFYLEGRGAGIQQVFQHFALVQVFQREQVLVARTIVFPSASTRLNGRRQNWAHSPGWRFCQNMPD